MKIIIDFTEEASNHILSAVTEDGIKYTIKETLIMHCPFVIEDDIKSIEIGNSEPVNKYDGVEFDD